MSVPADSPQANGWPRGFGSSRLLDMDPLGPNGIKTLFSQSPSDKQQRREQWRQWEQLEEEFQQQRKLMDERAASRPSQQFIDQRDEEERRIWQKDLRTDWMIHISIGGPKEMEAAQTIKKRWIEQGIWKKQWDEMASRSYIDALSWKHEEPLESESDSDTEAEPSSPTFSFAPKPPPKPRRPKTDDEKTAIAERQAVLEREREASRPYYQFIYQISKERERIQADSTEVAGAADAPDINTRAYESVKSTWTKRGIWNEKWGLLPGMSWKHEDPWEEEDFSNFTPVPETISADSYEGREAPVNYIFTFPSTDELKHRHESSALKSAILKNRNANPSSSASNSPTITSDKKVCPLLPPSTREGSVKDNQPMNTFYPILSPKAPKAIGKTKDSEEEWQLVSEVDSVGVAALDLLQNGKIECQALHKTILP